MVDNDVRGEREGATYIPPIGEQPRAEDVVIEQPSMATRLRTAAGYSPALKADEIPAVRNRVQWGPILGGLTTGMASLLVLTALGLAIGASAFKPGTDVTDWGAWAGIYGIASGLVSFFIGGWVAAKTSATGGTFSGLMNGLVTGATMLVALVWMTTTSLTNLVGFVGANLSNVAQAAVNNVSTTQVQNAASTAAANAPTVTYGDVQTGAWVTFVVLAVLVAAAVLGGWLGHNSRSDVDVPLDRPL
jgi:hypothetical protein